MLVVIFSCLSLAQKGDEHLDQLELALRQYALRQGHFFNTHQAKSVTNDNSSPPDSDLGKVDID